MIDERDVAMASDREPATDGPADMAADVVAVMMRTLATSLAHRINNPLCYSLADLSLVATEIAVDADPAEARRAAALFESIACLLRIRDVVSGLANFARTSPALRLDVPGVVEGAVDLVRADLETFAHLTVRVDDVEVTQGSTASLALLVLYILLHARHCLGADSPAHDRQTAKIRLVFARGSRPGESELSVRLTPGPWTAAQAARPRTRWQSSPWLELAEPVARSLGADIACRCDDRVDVDGCVVVVRFRPRA